MQADFGEAQAEIAGVERKIHFFAIDLPHSDACFVQAYPAECQSAPKRDPESAFNSDPHQRLSSGRPRSPRRAPARVAQCPHARRSDARAEALWAPGGDPRAMGLSFGS